ncbi:FtsK/SpoIIIE family DNA translocase [Macrococcus capreoli]|uniref:FtsK/SpoIIIE family DNA translocase n=1 Tax=Macrococcus capreoli TaxID=2982690 RepID=UPI0021D5E126|nr:DNA translocase FtsK [Macrococcus sp. TMW 2.2395]MCU7556511.1 DNA translocase FtsK [Macrococcus sp. TMW 2.2395]
MAVKKKSTRKKKTTRKKQNEPYRYVLSIVIICLLLFGIFQFGLVGLGMDSAMTYIFGSARFYAYILIALVTLYYAVNKKWIPMNRRVNGWLLLLFSTPSFMEIIQHFLKGKAVMPMFNQIFETHSQSGFHFFGGGLIGYAFDAVFSTLLSVFGALLLSVMMIVLSIVLILGRSIRVTAQQFLLYQIKQSQKLSERTKAQLQKRQEQKMTKTIKDVSNLPEVTAEEPVHEQIVDDIPIFDGNDVMQDAIHDDAPIKAQRDNEAFDGQEMNHQQTVSHEIDPTMSGESPTQSDTSEFENKYYELPPITLLSPAAAKAKSNMQAVKKRGQLLESTLKNFGVNAKVSQIRIGPAVTQYEVQPALGVKVSRIVNLHNDIALALAAKDIRIEAPIPGKSAVGIEVPNSAISMVTLREVIEASPVEENKLKVVLGRDISGEAVTAELDKMPHLLVAGATGSGKSVCINGIITSILMHAKPHEVKLMMIDPKMVELNVYNGIPHLLTPVVTNPQKAAQALQKIVGEMERRYDLFSHTGTRNIKGYNNYLKRQNEELGEKNAELPYIVVIVDELADLMMVASKDVEAAIMRLAQMARAAGIHLIIATQRPSVDVITGLIKANIPSRIAFSVSSAVDSRTILDMQGAEKLLGKGDMLYLPYGESKPKRIQGAFLSDKEVEDVVQFVCKQQSANYIKSLEPTENSTQQGASEDDLYSEAYQFVVEKQKASASLLQRQFRIGYNRAARLIDELEANGVIGPSTGSKPRSVLIENNAEIE